VKLISVTILVHCIYNSCRSEQESNDVKEQDEQEGNDIKFGPKLCHQCVAYVRYFYLTSFCLLV